MRSFCGVFCQTLRSLGLSKSISLYVTLDAANIQAVATSVNRWMNVPTQSGDFFLSFELCQSILPSNDRKGFRSLAPVVPLDFLSACCSMLLTGQAYRLGLW